MTRSVFTGSLSLLDWKAMVCTSRRELLKLLYNLGEALRSTDKQRYPREELAEQVRVSGHNPKLIQQVLSAASSDLPDLAFDSNTLSQEAHAIAEIAEISIDLHRKLRRPLVPAPQAPSVPPRPPQEPKQERILRSVVDEKGWARCVECGQKLRAANLRRHSKRCQGKGCHARVPWQPCSTPGTRLRLPPARTVGDLLLPKEQIGWVRCDLCGASVKEVNLRKHQAKCREKPPRGPINEWVRRLMVREQMALRAHRRMQAHLKMGGSAASAGRKVHLAQQRKAGESVEPGIGGDLFLVHWSACGVSEALVSTDQVMVVTAAT